MTDRERFEAWMADDLYGEDSCAFMRDKWGYVDPEIRRFEEVWNASRKQALQEAKNICLGVSDLNMQLVKDDPGYLMAVLGAEQSLRRINRLANPEGEQG